MKPRTLWACHSVAAMRSFRVTPRGRLSSSTTWAVLLPRRAVARLARCARLPDLFLLGAIGIPLEYRLE